MKTKTHATASTLLIIVSLLMASPFSKSAAQNPPPSEPQPLPEHAPTPRQKAAPQKLALPQRAPRTERTSTPEQDEDDIVRITTNLVQVDVVVTDSNGNQVINLTADDFEILEDGEPQKITNFSFVNNESEERRAPATVADATQVTTATGTRVQEPRRTIALVIDDLKMSFESTVHTRRAIKQFIDERMMPGDQVAIVRTSAGVGALQQFTSDKRQLYAAIEHIRRGGDTLIETLKRCQNSSFSPTLDPSTNAPTEKDPVSEFDGFREQSSFTGTLGAVNFIVRGLRELPGRKALVLFSDGLVICPDEQSKLGNLFQERLRKIADLANRSSVVVYAIDPRGLITLDDAAEAGGNGNVAISASRLSGKSAAIFNSQGSFDPIVYATGGFPVYNNNDIPSALQRVLNDQKGYYLIGYRPGESTFDSKKGQLRFNNLKVKLKRSGLTVRTRSGFYGFAETKSRPVPRTRDDQLVRALTSPFSSGAIDVRLTSLFGNEVSGSFMLSMLHIDPAGLTFTPQPDGWQQAVMDVLAITFNGDGQIVEQINKTQTIRARGNTFQRLMKSGLVYSLSVPIKKPGAYQLRISVRDAASERVGSASQFIEVPNLSKNQLALSGIAVRESRALSATLTPAGKPVVPSSSSAAGTEETSEPQAGPARRTFHQQSILDYDYVIYNATLTIGQPQLKTQVTVSRDGQEVLTGQEKSFDITGQSDLKRLKAAGRLLLGEGLPPGEYVLKITVVDLLAKSNSGTATQWIDFEIVK